MIYCRRTKYILCQCSIRREGEDAIEEGRDDGGGVGATVVVAAVVEYDEGAAKCRA